MTVNCYKGLTKTDTPVFTDEIIRYSINESRIAVTLKGGYPTLNMKYNDLIFIELLDDNTGNLSFQGRFLSMNYVVYDDPQGASTVIADNTILFELINS